MTDYAAKARDYLNKHFDIESLFLYETHDMDYIIEILINEIEVVYNPEATDEEIEIELDRHRAEIIDLVCDEYGEAIETAIEERESGRTCEAEKNRYEIKVMDGYTVETPEGFQEPKLKYFHVCYNYRVALKLYKALKKAGVGAVILSKNGEIKHFKTI